MQDVSNNGVSEVNPSLHITAVEPPKQKVDLSTLMFGDVCITRNGQKILASNIIVRHGNDFPYLFVTEDDGDFETCRDDGSVWGPEQAPQDIIGIERSTALERAKMLNELIDKPIFSK